MDNNLGKELITIWNFITDMPILGKIIKKDTFYNQVIIEHWVVDTALSTTDTPIIIPYMSCSISHPQFYSIELKVSIKECACANLYTAFDAVVIPS